MTPPTPLPPKWDYGFVGLEYVESYTDLMNAFGADWLAGDNHARQFGYEEGRAIAFDGLEYIASYGDLISALGANDQVGAAHYIQAGRFEGRATTFDGLEYIASYGDLINAFKSQVAADPNNYTGNHDIGSNHFIQNGHSEGRTDSFDPVQYLANYADLQAAFGADTELATRHYIIAGYAEDRTDDAI